LTYYLPAVTDPENESCIITMVGTSPAVTFSSPNILNISPGAIAVGTYIINI
jgi:hypothetical protein